MLQIWEVLLQLPEGQRLHQSFGSVLHGALMQYAHTDFAEAMHRSALYGFCGSHAPFCAAPVQPVCVLR